MSMLLMILLWISLAATPALAAEETVKTGPKFAIEGYLVYGNSLLPAGEIDRLLEPFTGPEKDSGTVQEALDLLQQTYRSRGYRAVAVLLPEQQLEGGVIRMQVVEPRLRTVTVEGNEHFSTENIRRSLPGLREGEVLNIDDISSSLQVANENPAKKIKMALQSGAVVQDQNVQLDVTDERPWHAVLTLDDAGTDETGDLRVGLLLSHANLFDRDQLLTLQGKSSIEKPDRTGIYALGYHVPIYSLGDSLDLFAAYSDVDSGTASAGIVDLDVTGEGTVFGLRYNQIFAQRDGFKQRLGYGFDYRNYDNQVSVGGIPLDNEVTVHPFSLMYGGSLQASKLTTAFNFSVARNFSGGSNGDNEAFKKVRVNAKPAYTVIRFAFDLLVPLPAQWQLLGRFNGQFTEDALVPGEYFGLGGAGSVRGFEDREVADDRGYFLGAELQTPDLAPTFKIPNSQLIFLAFYDSGHLDKVDALPGEINRTSIGSAGAGLRYQFGTMITARADYGFVIDGGGQSPAGSSRAHFSLSYIY
jgi:hemolysin activation/secretion protein